MERAVQVRDGSQYVPRRAVCVTLPKLPLLLCAAAWASGLLGLALARSDLASAGSEKPERETAALLGVLEESAIDSIPPRPQVRVAFRRTRAGWEPVSGVGWDSRSAGRPPRGQEWSVCLNGKPLGRLRTRQAGGGGAWANVHRPFPGQRLPFVGERSLEFSGWMRRAVHRPLAASAAGRCQDPDGWQLAPLPPLIRRLLVVAMRQATAGIRRCTPRGRTEAYAYPDADVLARSSLGARSGAHLAALYVRRSRQARGSCDGRAWADQLFYVDPAGKVLHLGSEMTVVGVGDYDGDGQSELLVKFERSNNDGYTLFFDGFERSVSFGWTYH